MGVDIDRYLGNLQMVQWGLGWTPHHPPSLEGVLSDMSVNASSIDPQEYLWYIGGDLYHCQNDLKLYNEGVGMTPGHSSDMLVNAFYHGHLEYIWIMVGDLDNFLDILEKKEEVVSGHYYSWIYVVYRLSS